MKNCTRVSEIWCEHAAGAVPSAEDKELVERHLEQCPTCRAEATAVDAFQNSFGTNSVPEISEFERRLFIEGSLKKHRKQVIERRSKNMSLRAMALAAVLILAIGSAVFWPKTVPQEQAPTIALTKKKPPVVQAPLPIGLVLTSGSVFKSDEKIERTEKFETGETISTKSGNAIVAIATGVRAYLYADTSLVATRVDSESVEIGLTRGQVLVAVEPEQVLGKVHVTTRAGRVTVTGTVFSVSDNAEVVNVAVLRGSVNVEHINNSVGSVVAGQRYDMTHTKVSDMSLEEVAATRRQLGAIEVTKCQQCSSLEINTTPVGATVRLDDREIGVTPISALVGKGNYSLSVTLDEHDSIKEVVQVGSANPLRRSYALVARQSPLVQEKPALAKKATRSFKSQTVNKVSREEDVAVVSGISALLKDVREARQHHNWVLVAQLYKKIVSQFPHHFEAQASWVSLGYIQLDHLKEDRQALASFDEYLKRQIGGSLVQEASYGRIKAFKAMGDNQSERESLEEFVDRFPEAIQIERARARLKDLTNK